MSRSSRGRTSRKDDKSPGPVGSAPSHLLGACFSEPGPRCGVPREPSSRSSPLRAGGVSGAGTLHATVGLARVDLRGGTGAAGIAAGQTGGDFLLDRAVLGAHVLAALRRATA